MTYIFIFIASLLAVSLDFSGMTAMTGEVGYDALVTNFMAVVATLNNIGPGLGAVGPAGNFAFYSDFSKIIFIFDMLAGRLELVPLLLLFNKETWKKF